MKLAVFDIDGTLTDTNRVDGDCFIRAFAEAHSIRELNTDWGLYPHTTDSGIAESIFQERLGRAPHAFELERLRECFVGLLEEQSDSRAQLFRETPGASAFLSRLRREKDWAVAIATGCWRASAELKLRAAGIDFEGIPAAFAADEMLSREEILEDAIGKARRHYGLRGFERITSIGDGLWDLRAAARLGLAFLGVGSLERAERLKEAGASHVVADFTDYESVLCCLNGAEIPRALH